MPISRPKKPDKPPADVLAREVAKREREVILEYLEKHQGNVGATAAALGVSRRTLEGKMAAHGLRADAASFREGAGIPGRRS